MSERTLDVYSYASGLAANDAGTADGPKYLQQYVSLKLLQAKGLDLRWAPFVTTDESLDKLTATVQACEQLGEMVYQALDSKQFPLVFGGDHSCAIGTWSGVFRAVSSQGPMGLIWIDAHMDAHTHDTSLTGNIHGMPLASLLGQGRQDLTQLLASAPKLRPEHVCVIGVRSFEEAEAALLQQLGVTFYHMDEVDRLGLSAVFQDALSIVTQGTAGFGISLDLDALDPEDAPGVGCVEPGGIAGAALCDVLAGVGDNPNLLALEITEYNPHADKEDLTAKFVARLLEKVFL